MPRNDTAEEVKMVDRNELKPYEDFVDYLERYTRQNPSVVALTCLGLGFILGWKLKPW